jgi:hypothetical protein
MAMMICKFFYQPTCIKCPPAKRIVEELKKRGVPIEEYDISTVRGLTEATMNAVLSTPTLLMSSGDQCKLYTDNFQQILG